MENKKEDNTKSLVILLMLLLFFAFLVAKPFSPTPTAYLTLPLIGDTSELSDPTLIGGIAILVAIWIIVLILYRKLKKKSRNDKLSGLPEVPQPISNIETPTPQEIQKKEGLTEEELKQLFREIAPKIEPVHIEPVKETKPLINEKELEMFEQRQKQAKPAEKLTGKERDITGLKKLMGDLLKKNYTKVSILRYLQKKDWRLSEIAQAVREINETNLFGYIRQAISLGYKREQFQRLLMSKGWTNDEIEIAVQKLQKPVLKI